MEKIKQIIKFYDNFLENKIDLGELWDKTRLPIELSDNRWASEYNEAWLNLEIIYVMNRNIENELDSDEALELLNIIALLKEILESSLRDNSFLKSL